MIRRMLGCKRHEGEDMEVFMQRTNQNINNLMSRHSVVAWDTLANRAVFRSAGKLVSIKEHDPSRVTALVFSHKDWKWVQTIAQSNNGRQLHCRYLRVWRWERPLYKFLGIDWQKCALDPDQWSSIEHKFLSWRSVNR